jgi:hypothetical protein
MSDLPADTHRGDPMTTPARMPLEGTILDRGEGHHRLAQAMVESLTEFDFDPGHQHSLPDHLREGLLAWVRAFDDWDRDDRA